MDFTIDLEGQRRGCVCVYQMDFVVQQKLRQHCEGPHCATVSAMKHSTTAHLEKESEEKRIYICALPNHLAVLLKLTQLCKSTIILNGTVGKIMNGQLY